MDTQYSTFTLPNGLRIIHTPSSTNVVYCGLAIDAGTRDEMPEESGMAHFCEHMVFKGTTHRKSWHIINRLESVGGDLNAYTNKEETVVYAAILKEHLERATELISDIVFNSVFPQNEIDKEVEVILDEIDSYKDSPSELIFDDFENLIFQNHPLGRNILGDEALLKQYTTADALRWTQRFYTPDNMVFFVRGDVDFDKVVKLAHKYMGGYGNQTVNHAMYGMTIEQQSDYLKARSAKRRSKPLPYRAENVMIDKDTHQAHVMIGGRGFDAYDEKRTALYLLNDILGGPGMNSRLNISLREKRGLVYSVESNITSYTDTGAFCIYFGCDEHDYKKCIRLVKSELLNLCNKPLSTAVLVSAKRQIKGEIGVAADNFENTILSAAKCFLHYGKFESQAKLFKRIDNLTAETLQTVAQEVFADDKISTIIYT